MSPRIRTALAVAVAAAAVVIAAFGGLGGDDPTDTVAASTTTTVADETRVVVRASDLPIITRAELPAEALLTLDLIESGGPFPYRQDDGIFQNREGILPAEDREHYREYTVDTPGSDDRGARRIVAGADGERYYTDDHYDSFREIVGP